MEALIRRRPRRPTRRESFPNVSNRQGRPTNHLFAPSKRKSVCLDCATCERNKWLVASRICIKIQERYNCFRRTDPKQGCHRLVNGARLFWLRPNLEPIEHYSRNKSSILMHRRSPHCAAQLVNARRLRSCVSVGERGRDSGLAMGGGEAVSKARIGYILQGNTRPAYSFGQPA